MASQYSSVRKKLFASVALNRNVDDKDRKKVHRFPVPALLTNVISITSVKIDTKVREKRICQI